MAEKRYWEAYKVGEEIVTNGVTITEGHILDFCNLTMQVAPIHIDEEFAKKTPFGRRIASGGLILSLGMGLSSMAGVFEETMIAAMGFNSIKILAPVFAGDTIRARVTIKEKRETQKPDRGIVFAAHEIQNQRNEPVQSFEFVALVQRQGK